MERVCRDACQQGRREILVAALEGQMSGLLLDQFPRRAPVRALRINTRCLRRLSEKTFPQAIPGRMSRFAGKAG